jgi:hypothetical protein
MPFKQIIVVQIENYLKPINKYKMQIDWLIDWLIVKAADIFPYSYHSALKGNKLLCPLELEIGESCGSKRT